MKRSLPLLLMALATPAAAPLSAQEVLREDFGPADRGWFGAAVASAGDVDDDGHPDVIVGAFFEDSGLGPGQGAAYVISGASGAVLWREQGAFANGRYGTAVAGIGDVTGDGHDDFAVSATIEADGFGGLQGVVRAYSGANGALLARIARPATENFGLTMAAAGDLDGDGRCDLLVGAPTASPGGGFEGSVFAYSGFDGRLLHRRDGSTQGEGFGEGLAGVGDVDADGFDDFAVGAPRFGAPQIGRVQVWSGTSGALLHDWTGLDGSEYGASVAAAGDVDGDGFGDVVIGSPNFPTALFLTGAVFVQSGRDGSNILGSRGDTNDLLGASVASVRDFDGDGVREILAASPSGFTNNMRTGSVWAISGATNTPLFRHPGPLLAQFGRVMAPVGDVNHDGFEDWAVGAPQDSRQRPDGGSVTIMSGGRGPALVLDPLRFSAGGFLTIAGSGGTSFGSYLVAGARRSGRTAIPGCEGLVLNLTAPRRVAVGTFFLDGSFDVTAWVPPALRGRSYQFQVFEAALCRVSNKQTIFLP